MIKNSNKPIREYESGRPRPSATAMSVLTGTSFKPEHLQAILQDGLPHGFFEIHAENYMGAGGKPHRMLETLRSHYPLSVHGVSMSIGGPSPLDTQHLSRFREVIRRYEPSLVSEHLAWSSHDGIYLNDLLPLPYTAETLDGVCSHINQVQDAIQRQLLIENPATYVTFASSTLSETDFLREVVKRTGCGLLLDINNVFVSATNHGFRAQQYLAEFPLESVGEVHLAGHSAQTDDEGDVLLIDSHDRAVADPVWVLYETLVTRTGPVPTLIEWDSELPDWPVLKNEAIRARALMSRDWSFQILSHFWPQAEET